MHQSYQLPCSEPSAGKSDRAAVWTQRDDRVEAGWMICP